MDIPPSHHSHHSHHSRSPTYSHSRHRQSYYPQVATTSYGNPGYSTSNAYYYPSTHSHHHSSHSRQPQYVTPTSYGNYYGSGSRRGGNYYVSDGSRSHHGGGHHYYQSGHVSITPFFSVPKTLRQFFILTYFSIFQKPTLGERLKWMFGFGHNYYHDSGKGGYGSRGLHDSGRRHDNRGRHIYAV